MAQPSINRPKRKPKRKLMLSGLGAATWEREIPTRWLNSVIGVFLLPLVFLLTKTLIDAFSKATLEHEFWATEEFWFFSLGAVLWTLAFYGSVWVFGEPRPLRVYVFGHELTHAIWVWAMNGKVSHFQVARDGGHILTDTHNVWIALAPYFYPLYSLVVIALYGVLSLFYDLSPYTPVLFGLIGLTWAFHLTFTIWIIPKGQTDLTHFGTFYSLVIILLMNVLLLSGLLIFGAPEVTFAAFGAGLLHNSEEFAGLVWESAQALLRSF